jgi:hypothetical protein
VIVKIPLIGLQPMLTMPDLTRQGGSASAEFIEEMAEFQKQIESRN